MLDWQNARQPFLSGLIGVAVPAPHSILWLIPDGILYAFGIITLTIVLRGKYFRPGSGSENRDGLRCGGIISFKGSG